MRSFGSLWLCDVHAERDSVPDANDSIPVTECHEWDGLFSVQAAAPGRRVSLTAWCDGRDAGQFAIEQDDVVVAHGNTRVVHAPELVESDGYTFPPGSHFGVGLWSIECESDGSPSRLIKIEILDWNSTD